jgi:neurotransmitter:Na+ symporter, NSS family
LVEPFDTEVQKKGADTITREIWGTRAGFVLAAVGSAVGLGNMWRFPYAASEGGGAAFVVLYIIITLLIGIPLMLGEFAVGRRTHLSPIGALRKAAGKAWVPLGFLFVAAGLLILSYYSVIAGWTVRYAGEAILYGFPGDPGARFDEISTGGAAVFFHLLFMAVTIGVVMSGVQKGIERAALVLMPALFIILVGLAIWAATLEGATEGYLFFLRPSLDELFDLNTLAQATAQAFFSLSLGMGAMLTFASYLSKHEDLNREAVVISFSDFMIAFIAGLVVFPVIAALALQDQVGASTLGALFISLPGAFEAMGGIGRVVGAFFFVALVVGALTSAISLLEVVTSSVIDEYKLDRRKAAIGAGLLIAGLGVFSALDLSVLGLLDAIAGELFLVIGAFGISIVVGWVMKDPAQELLDGAGPTFSRFIGLVLFMMRWVVPVVIGLVLVQKLFDSMGAVREFLGG